MSLELERLYLPNGWTLQANRGGMFELWSPTGVFIGVMAEALARKMAADMSATYIRTVMVGQSAGDVGEIVVGEPEK